MTIRQKQIKLLTKKKNKSILYKKFVLSDRIQLLTVHAIIINSINND